MQVTSFLAALAIMASVVAAAPSSMRESKQQSLRKSANSKPQMLLEAVPGTAMLGRLLITTTLSLKKTKRPSANEVGKVGMRESGWRKGWFQTVMYD